MVMIYLPTCSVLVERLHVLTEWLDNARVIASASEAICEVVAMEMMRK